jgi:hypothetical protein
MNLYPQTAHPINLFHCSHTLQVLKSCIEQQPDLFMSELQEWLEGACGIKVSPAMIHQTLMHPGFSHKKVNNIDYVLQSWKV